MRAKHAQSSIKRKATLFLCSCLAATPVLQTTGGFLSECSNAERETREQTQSGVEGLVRQRQRAAKHQRGTWKPMALPKPSVSFCTRTHCHRGTQYPEHKHGNTPREVCCRSKRRSEDKEKEAAMEKDGGRECEEVTGRRVSRVKPG